ncbi:MAG: transcription termination/antitermination protein NusG [Candidatus Methylacidiphilales bacterium]
MIAPSTLQRELDIDELRWWVLHSRPRCEKKIDTALNGKVDSVYLPCRPSRRHYPGKSVTFQIPLFPGYLFARFCERDRITLFQNAPLASIIWISDQERFHSQLEALRQVLDSAKEANLCPFIEIGSRIRISSGRFKGIEGIVRRRAGRSRLIVSIDILQQSVEVELAADGVAIAA